MGVGAWIGCIYRLRRVLITVAVGGSTPPFVELVLQRGLFSDRLLYTYYVPGLVQGAEFAERSENTDS